MGITRGRCSKGTWKQCLELTGDLIEEIVAKIITFFKLNFFNQFRDLGLADDCPLCCGGLRSHRHRLLQQRWLNQLSVMLCAICLSSKTFKCLSCPFYIAKGLRWLMAPLRDIVRILYFFKNTHSVYLDVCGAHFLCESFSIV